MANRLPQSYFEGLPEDAKARYRSKLELIGGLDPFYSSLGEPSDTVPPVEACDLVAYLVLQTSFITNKQFKARKSLEAYNQFVSGWIKEVKVWEITDSRKFVVKGRVSWQVAIIIVESVITTSYCVGAGTPFTEVCRSAATLLDNH